MSPVTSTPATSCAWARTRSTCGSPIARSNVDRGAADEPAATIETDTATFSELIWDGRDLADALRAGDITIDGDHGAVTRFLGLFPRPAPAA